MPRRKRTEAQEAARFGRVLPLVAAAAAGLGWWRGHPLAAAIVAGIGVAGFLLSAAAPRTWLRIFRGWMKLAEALGFVMTRVILGLFFFLVLTPVGLVMRLAGRDALDTAFRDRKPTYWIDKDPVETTLERYEKQF